MRRVAAHADDGKHDDTRLGAGRVSEAKEDPVRRILSTSGRGGDADRSGQSDDRECRSAE